MENLDVIILTSVVVVSFVVFIVTSVQEFGRMEEEPWEYEKATGPSRAALFNVLSSLFEDDKISGKNREELKGAIKRSIWLFRSDHASDFGQTVPLRKIIQSRLIFIHFSRFPFLKILL